MTLDQAQKDVLCPFFTMRHRDGTKVSAGAEYVFALVDFRFASGQARTRVEQAIDHSFKIIVSRTTEAERTALTQLISGLCQDQYTRAEIREALKKYRQELSKKTAPAPA